MRSFVCHLITFIAISISSLTPLASMDRSHTHNVPVVIYHAFNEKYTVITAALKAIKDQGYTHIQISPAQESRTTIPHTHTDGGTIEELWWLRYQPINYTVLSNANGTHEELTQLAFEANKLGLQLIGDLTFNYLAALPGLERKEWSSAFKNKNNNKKDYREQLSRLEMYQGFSMEICMRDPNKKPLFLNGNPQVFKECMEDFEPWGDKAWYSGSCPKLRPTHRVLSIHNNHIDSLMKIGINNFRFDAAKHLSTEALQAYISHIKEGKIDSFNYFECVNDHNLNRYNNLGPITDYNYGYDVLGKVFSYNGDLKDLRHSHPLNENDILFAETHDTAERRKIGHRGKGVDEVIKDNIDMLLGQAYILARNGGVPIILSSFMNDKFVRQGVKFRQMLKVQSQFGHVDKKEQYIDINGIDSKVVMILMRDDGHGIFLMNKGSDPITIHMDKLPPNKNYTIIPTENNDGKIEYKPITDSSISLAGRDVLYLISEECYKKFEEHHNQIF